MSSTRLFLRTEARPISLFASCTRCFFRTFRIASLVLFYWSCFAMHTTYSSVPFKPTPTVPLQLQSLSTPTVPLQLQSLSTPTVPLQLQSLSTPTVPLQLQSLSTPTVPLQLSTLGRSAYSQPPAASHSLVYKLHFDSIQVE
jgi:hypothetical protein